MSDSDWSGQKFQQLKSSNFVNSLYLDSPERIEALTYIIVISLDNKKILFKNLWHFDMSS
jgi:hypothetical protein